MKTENLSEMNKHKIIMYLAGDMIQVSLTKRSLCGRKEKVYLQPSKQRHVTCEVWAG
jgi:hypothetical protein